jgi:hypothetical protein
MVNSFIKKHRDKIFLSIFLLQAAFSFAQDGDDSLLPGGMRTLMNDIVGIFTGGFVKGILIASLGGCAVAYGFNKDNEKMKRNIIAIAVACAILFAASAIVTNVTKAAAGS